MDVHVRSQSQGEVSARIPDDAASASDGDDNTLRDQFSKESGESPGCLLDTSAESGLGAHLRYTR